MQLQDLIEENDNAASWHFTAYEPNCSEEEVRRVMNEEISFFKERLNAIRGMTPSELNRYKKEVENTVEKAIRHIQGHWDTYFALRKTTEQIELERNILGDAFMQEVYGDPITEKEDTTH